MCRSLSQIQDFVTVQGVVMCTESCHSTGSCHVYRMMSDIKDLVTCTGGCHAYRDAVRNVQSCHKNVRLIWVYESDTCTAGYHMNLRFIDLLRRLSYEPQTHRDTHEVIT